MYLNLKHPKFDLAMELLCMLPREPLTVSYRSLSDDLHIREIGAAGALDPTVTSLINRLKMEGFVIGTTIHEGRRIAFIRKGGWERANHAGQAYWRAVYAKEMVPDATAA